jgi:hypothetical protein
MKWIVALMIAIGWGAFGLAQHPIAFLETPRQETNLSAFFTTEFKQVPFRLAHGLIHLRAELDGQPGTYLLDTGAPGLVVNAPARSVGNVQGVSCAGTISVGQQVVGPFSWAERRWPSMDAFSLDLTHLESYAGHHIAGLIGYSLFADRILFIDYERELLTLLDPRRLDLEHLGNPRVNIALSQEGHLPIVTIEINGQFFRFGLDTGAEANLLDKGVLEAMDAACLTGLELAEVQGLDQSVQRVESVLWHNLQLGGHTFTGRFLLTDLAHLGAVSEKPIHGILGYSFLSQFKVAINYPQQQLLLW